MQGVQLAINAIDTSYVINVSNARDASLKIALQSAFLGQPILRVISDASGANNASNMSNAKNSRKPSKESQPSNAS